MRDRAFLYVALIALAILIFQNAGFVPTARSAWTARTSAATREHERAEIEKLHQLDVAATLSGDFKTLVDASADDIVRLQQGAEPDVGKPALIAANERRKAALPGFRVLTYAPEIKELTLTNDGWAFEWGTFTGSYVEAADREEKRIRGNLLRIYRSRPTARGKPLARCGTPLCVS